MSEVYALAADMGGMGFISANHALILYNNSLINLHTLEAARANGVKRYLYTSSACIYPEHLQETTDVRPLKEDDAYPAFPQDAYGWEKLISERLCMHYRKITASKTRTGVSKFFEKGMGRGAKAPRDGRKIAMAKLSANGIIYGARRTDGHLLYDVVEGLHA